jgi:hypothetical protein
METLTNFSKVNHFNLLCQSIFDLFNPQEFSNIENIEYLKDNPEDNNINIDYNNNNKLYWVEDKDKFEHFNFKIYSMNYKDFTVINIINLLYFVPIFKITYYKNKYEVKTPGNEYFTLDENMNILAMSSGLKKFSKIQKKYKNSLNSGSERNIIEGKNFYCIFDITKGFFHFLLILICIPIQFSLSIISNIFHFEFPNVKKLTETMEINNFIFNTHQKAY